MNSLAGKAALITGVSRRSGIGFGIARRLASLGADLFLHSFTAYDKAMASEDALADAEELHVELREHGTKVVGMEADFLDPLAPSRVMATAVEALGRVPLLVLNHTHDTTKTLHELTSEEIDRHLAVSVRASLLLVQEFAKRHDGQPDGRVVLMTSGQHLGPMPHLAYVASKGALHQLTWSLSNELIGAGITVNAVNPGPTKTYVPDPEIDRAVVERMPRGRWGTPDDAARLIAWLVSDDAQWVTGQVINSEGGFRRS